MTASAVEQLSLCGHWESAVLPASGVYGQLTIGAVVPANTTASYQLNIDGAGFVGPDGTGSTSFASGDIVPYR
ncbi:MAG: hypothetical protein R2706_04580 [Acidimicrobiales bacterium]